MSALDIDTDVPVSLTTQAGLEADFQHQASLALGKLEVHLLDDGLRAIMVAWAHRREAIAIATAENMGTDEVRLSTLLGDESLDVFGKSDRLAADLFAASNALWRRSDDALSEEQVRKAWELSDASNLRRQSTNHEWVLERSCQIFLQAFQTIENDPRPFTVSEVFRTLLTGDSFFGSSRRMARLALLRAIALGMKTPHTPLPLCKDLGGDADRLHQVLADPDAFFVFFLSAAAKAAAKTLDACLTYKRLRKELVDLCAPQRKNSSVAPAVDLFLTHPVLTQAKLRELLGCSTRGTMDLVEKMVSAGCIAPLDMTSSKNRAFVCRKALNVSV